MEDIGAVVVVIIMAILLIFLFGMALGATMEKSRVCVAAGYDRATISDNNWWCMGIYGNKTVGHLYVDVIAGEIVE